MSDYTIETEKDAFTVKLTTITGNIVKYEDSKEYLNRLWQFGVLQTNRALHKYEMLEASLPTDTITITKAEYDGLVADAERMKAIATNKLGVHFENNTLLGEIVEVYSNYDEDGNCHVDTERLGDSPIDALRQAIDSAKGK